MSSRVSPVQRLRSEIDEVFASGVDLAGAVELLRVGGRLVVISFHSLEDRIVKRYMRDMARGQPIPRGVPVPDSALERRLRIVGKAIRPDSDEVAGNPRARSAIMRVAEKTG